jgi:hypothetical protein
VAREQALGESQGWFDAIRTDEGSRWPRGIRVM